MSDKEIEKLNHNIKDLNKTILNIGKLMNDAILTLHRACQILEDELHNKPETVDVLCNGEVVQTVGIDHGKAEGDVHVESYQDIKNNCNIIIYRRQGKVFNVTKEDLDGTQEDITKHWLNDNPYEMVKIMLS